MQFPNVKLHEFYCVYNQCNCMNNMLRLYIQSAYARFGISLLVSTECLNFMSLDMLMEFYILHLVNDLIRERKMHFLMQYLYL